MKKIRRHFQLLELLIAMFLIVVCAMPILSAYISMGKVQYESARFNQRDHIAHLIHAKIVENLYGHIISWEELIRGRQEKLEKMDGIGTLVEQLKKLGFEGHYQIAKQDKPIVITGRDPKIYKYLFNIQIILQDISVKDRIEEPTTYRYQVYVESDKKEDDFIEIKLEDLQDQGVTP